MRSICTSLVGVVIVLACSGRAIAADSESPVGRKVENFTLRDYRGKEHSLSDFRDAKLVVVAFLGTECPVAKLYSSRLVKLAREFESRSVAFLGINANRQDSITEMAAHARRYEVPFPVLKDLGNHVADQMGAVRTPEVFVLDESRIVRYWGRIDDQYGVGLIRDEPTREDLRIALDELLDGKPVSQPAVKSVGCYIGRVREPNPNSEVTYSNQIARIFQKRCVECHRPGEIAPFTLTNYDEVAGWADTIAEVVRDRRMPPWHADPAHGQFANDRRLSEQECELISQWVANGAPQGDPEHLPAPREYVTGWQLPEQPDEVIYMRDEPFRVAAEGVVRYQYFVVDPGFTEDKWVRAAEIIPDNREVVHHILVLVRPPQDVLRESVGVRDRFLVGYVPGHRARTLPEGMAKHIPAGSKLIFQVHYTPNGTEQLDRSKVGFVFADPETVTHQVATIHAINTKFEIPPHADNHRVEALSRQYDHDLQVLGFMPHMHLRGKSFRYELMLPNGRKDILLDVPHYDFNWQTAYRLAKPVPFPAGARMHCVAHYDNSENNFANPDPTKAVRWGDQTWEEMMIGYFDVAIPIEKVEIANQESGE